MNVHALYTPTDEDSLRKAIASLPPVIGDTSQSSSASSAQRLVEVGPVLVGLKDMTPENWRSKRG